MEGGGGVEQPRKGRGGSQEGGQAPRCGRALVSSGVTQPWGYRTPRGSVLGLFPQNHGYNRLFLSLSQVACVTPGLERAWHVRGRHRSGCLGPGARGRPASPWDSMWAVGLATPWPLPAASLPDLGQHPIGSPVLPSDAIEEARSQVAMEQERNQKERHAETLPKAQSDRFGKWGSGQRPLNKVTYPPNVSLDNCFVRLQQS